MNHGEINSQHVAQHVVFEFCGYVFCLKNFEVIVLRELFC